MFYSRSADMEMDIVYKFIKSGKKKSNIPPSLTSQK